MALPYDALTAALDAWLGQHIPSLTRRARVRQAVDCLDDLRTAPYAHIEFATNVSSWPALPRLRFLRALRELRGEPVARARRDARVGRWVDGPRTASCWRSTAPSANRTAARARSVRPNE